MREGVGDKATWYSVQCMQVLGRGNSMETGNEDGEAMEPDEKNREAAWAERTRELETENARLQALVCYLVHNNEELRRRHDGKEDAGLVD